MTFEVAVERLRAVARVSEQLPMQLPNGVPSVDAARVRLSEGLPALAGEPLIDWPTLAANVASLGGDAQELGEEIGGATLVEASLAGEWDALGGVSGSARQITLLDYAVRPVLRAGFNTVRDVIAASRWTAGHCPACGSLPTLAELRGSKEGQSRVLRCARCTAAWSFERLACPACGERDHAQLRYLHVDGELEYRRAECCLTCGFYVKGVARLDAIVDSALLDVDLETVALDALALRAGYRATA